MSEPGHLSPEQLDELVSGTGTDDPGAATHLADCPDCTAAWQTQLAVHDLLQAAPDPGPIPADVAARIDAALTAAAGDLAAGGTSGPAGGTAGSTGAAGSAGGVGPSASATVLPIQPARERRLAAFSPRTALVGKALVGVAAAALIVGGGYAALHTSPHSSSASSANDSKGDASAAAGGAIPQAGRPVQVQASGTAYTKDNIVAKVTGLLASGDVAAPARPTPNAPVESTLTTPAGLHACLLALDAGTVSPLLVDLATFDGKPVAVLVLPHGTGREIWAVSRDCAGTNDGTVFYALLP